MNQAIQQARKKYRRSPLRPCARRRRLPHETAGRLLADGWLSVRLYALLLGFQRVGLARRRDGVVLVPQRTKYLGFVSPRADELIIQAKRAIQLLQRALWIALAQQQQAKRVVRFGLLVVNGEGALTRRPCLDVATQRGQRQRTIGMRRSVIWLERYGMIERRHRLVLAPEPIVRLSATDPGLDETGISCDRLVKVGQSFVVAMKMSQT